MHFKSIEVLDKVEKVIIEAAKAVVNPRRTMENSDMKAVLELADNGFSAIYLGDVEMWRRPIAGVSVGGSMPTSFGSRFEDLGIGGVNEIKSEKLREEKEDLFLLLEKKEDEVKDLLERAEGARKEYLENLWKILDMTKTALAEDLEA